MLMLDNFNYFLPAELIANFPSDERDHSRLLIGNAIDKTIENKYFYQLPTIIKNNLCKLNEAALLIVNNSHVYPARVRIQRANGTKGEVFLLEQGERDTYSCLLRPSNKMQAGEILYSADLKKPIFQVHSLEPPRVKIINDTFNNLLQQYGEIPLPPYIKRKVQPKVDSERYQTVYSDIKQAGSMASPTAGLHFTDKTLTECKALGIESVSVTLNIGLGTFMPVKTQEIDKHDMHQEYYYISSYTIKKILEYQKNKWPIIYVGTTSLRAVESFFRSSLALADKTDRWLPTNLFLYPKNQADKIKPHVGNAIITNFHQPKSTLVMLIAALLGYEFWQECYAHAIGEKYRFFSYGDSSLLIFNQAY